jgi:hypothetical protein
MPVAIATVMRGVPEKFQFLVETAQVADGCGPVSQGGKHWLLVHQMVVTPGIQ